MDYDINLATLTSKKSEIEDLKTKAEDIYNEFNSCYLNQLASTEIRLITANLRQSVKRLKEGVTNSNTWYTKYITELTALEDSLASFSGNLTAPTEFKGEFVDMFGKVTMPIIKTGGDIHANASSNSKLGNTQASEFYKLGDLAYNESGEMTDDSARAKWIKKVAEIVKNTNTYGIKKSLIIAQIINESGWMSSHASSLSDYNNVLGMNTDMGSITPDMQDSTWSKKRTSGYNDVTQWSSDGSHVVGTNEEMRHYDSIEECIEDYANIVYLCHPELKGDNNIWDYDRFLKHYTPNPKEPVVYKYARIIKDYNLEQYDE